MGRNKITIRRIENERSRQATFMKRKAGLVKKAMELSILCDCEVALVIFSSSNKLFLYSSESTEHIMNRFAEHTDPYRPLTNADYMRQFGGSPDKDAPDSPPQQQQQQQQQSGPARHGSLSRAAKAAAARAREIEENAEELPSIPHMGMSMGTVAAAAVAAASAAVGGSAAAEAATTGKHKHGKGAPPPAAAAAAEELSGAQTPPPPVSPSLMGPTTLAQALSGAASQISSSLGLSNDPEQYVLTPRTAARYRTVNLKYMVPSPAAAAAIGGSGAMATTPSSFLSPTGTSLFSPLKGFYSPTSYPFGPLPSPSAASLGLGMPLSPTTPYFAVPSANPNAFTAQLGDADEPAAAAAPGAEQPAAPAAEQPAAPAPAPTEEAAAAATSASPASSTTSASPKQKYKKNLSVVIPENRGIDRSVHPVSAAEIVPSSLLHPSSSPADAQGRGGSGGSSEASALLAAAAARGSLHSGSAPSAAAAAAAAAATTAAAEDDDVAMNEEPTSQSPHSRPADDKLPAKKRRVTFEDTPLSKVAKREDG